jgi:hypothetical protein
MVEYALGDSAKREELVAV